MPITDSDDELSRIYENLEGNSGDTLVVNYIKAGFDVSSDTVDLFEEYGGRCIWDPFF